MSNLPTRVFPLDVDPELKVDGSFRIDDKRYPSYVDAQVRACETEIIALKVQIATATPSVAVIKKIYTVADTGTTLPTTSAGIGVDTTGGPVQLFVPSFAATPRAIAIADASALNTPGSQGFAAHPFTLEALGPVLWDPIKKALVSSLTFSQYGFQGTFLAILNHPRLGSFFQQTADSLALTNVLFGGVVQSSLTPTVILPAQSGILEVDTTGGPMVAMAPDLAAYSPYQVAIVDTSGANNALVRNPLTLTTTGGLQIEVPWGPPGHPELARTLQGSLVLGGTNDWPPMKTVLLTLVPTTPPKFQVTG
ncbi:MAG TPA: hypothetical protein VGI39_03170 [Polyangiaceae bacterium]|jgi:hypothetical protein